MKRDFDVIVVGGGISGCCAALAASRRGADVLLIERYGFLGGTLTACGTGPMMTFHCGDMQAVGGIMEEIVQRLTAKGLSPGHLLDTTGYTWTVTPFDAEGLKAELELMLLESGASVLYHSWVTAVYSKCDNRIDAIRVVGKNAAVQYTGRCIVDATGDADLSAMMQVVLTARKRGLATGAVWSDALPALAEELAGNAGCGMCTDACASDSGLTRVYDKGDAADAGKQPVDGAEHGAVADAGLSEAGEVSAITGDRAEAAALSGSSACKADSGLASVYDKGDVSDAGKQPVDGAEHGAVADADLSEAGEVSAITGDRAGAGKNARPADDDAVRLVRKGRESDGKCQPVTMNFKVYGVDTEKLRRYIKENPASFPRLAGRLNLIDRASRLSVGGFVEVLRQAQKDGRISFAREDILLFETNNPGEFIVNTSRVTGIDPLDPGQLTRAEIEGRRQCQQIFSVLKTDVPGFADARIAFTGPMIGIRSSRQIIGRHTITEQELLSRHMCCDAVACGAYPIDVHPPEGVDYDMFDTPRLPKNTCYYISYRALIGPIDNLITVGRCISTTFAAQAAIRVSPIAGAIGQAGGVAAALCASAGATVDRVPVSLLREALIEQGAFLQPQVTG